MYESGADVELEENVITVCTTGGRTEVFVVVDTPRPRSFWRHWFSYEVIKKGIYSIGLGAGFERVEKQFE